MEHRQDSIERVSATKMLILLLLACLQETSRDTPREADAMKDAAIGRQAVMADDKIPGRRDAREKEFPWMVAVMRLHKQGHWTFFCGGTIIREDVVLTAAHCLDAYRGFPLGEPQDLEIRAGFLSFLKPGPNIQVRKVKSIIRHTHYVYARNDIALLELACPFNFSKSNGRILSLPAAPRGHRVTGRVKFAGWGAERRNGPKSAVLRAGFLKIASEDYCRKTYKIYGRQFFCAGGGGGNACTLDGGGAAVQKLSGVFVLVGIAERFGDCREQPSLFLRIEKYYDWINENIPVLGDTDTEPKQTATSVQ